MAKFIFITGGVVSSLGKGITAASIGQILKSRGLKVFIQKFDPYINVDPGTMSPYQHGEVFVTDDGAETDLDLGHYERFIDENLSKYSSVSTGKIYSSVIEKEREGMYNGATIQVIPHITDEIKQKLVDAAKYSNADVIITEIGGTVGDIESLPYLEAIRQARRDFGYKNTIYIHNTLVPYLRAAKEIKTKPTQHSVKELRSLGIQPDILVLRSEVKVPQSSKDKIALFSDIPTNAVFESLDVDVIYQIILDMKKQKVDDFILEHFRITDLPEPDLSAWEGLITKIRGLEKKVNIALVGKYISLQDAYLSLVESLRHSGYHHNVEINIKWIDSSTLTPDNIVEQLGDCSGIVVPGGFGKEATAGKVLAINYARVNNVPFLGICFGMQLALIEYARNVFKLENATSREIEHEATNQLIDRNKNHEYRKGSFVTIIDEKSKLNEIYGTNIINERYRHKFSFNFDYKEIYEKDKNVLLSSFTNNNEILSSFELVNHPWFIAVQYHPEFLSRPLKAHPLFNSFVKELIK